MAAVLRSLGIGPPITWMVGWTGSSRLLDASASMPRLHSVDCTASIDAPLAYRTSVTMSPRMSENPDPVVRKTVSLPASLWRRIEDFQFENRIKRDAQGVRRLLELGLAAAEADQARQGKPEQ